jgi:hypothetical protein
LVAVANEDAEDTGFGLICLIATECIVKDGNSFIRDLGESRIAVNDFAARCRERGVMVWLPPERTRPDESVRSQYADDGDLMVQGRVEHKVRTNLTFTCRADYPYATVIVDEVYKEDEKSGDPPLMYVIEDKTRTHAAIVYGWTRKHWQKETKHDPIQNRECVFYTVDKRHVRFCMVEEVF